MFNQRTTILIAGVGGQGTLLASSVIGNTAVRLGLKTRISETFGESQRGGSVITHIRIGEDVYSPITPLHSAELLIGLEPLETYRNAVKYLKPGGNVIYNIKKMYPGSIKEGYPTTDEMTEVMKSIADKVIPINATELAVKAGGQIMLNIVMLGAASNMLFLGTDEIKKTITEIGKNVESNLYAFKLGLKYYEENLNSISIPTVREDHYL